MLKAGDHRQRVIVLGRNYGKPINLVVQQKITINNKKPKGDSMNHTLWELTQNLKKARMNKEKRLRPQTVNVKRVISVDDDRVLNGMMMSNGYDKLTNGQRPTLDMYDNFPTEK